MRTNCSPCDLTLTPKISRGPISSRPEDLDPLINFSSIKNNNNNNNICSTPNNHCKPKNGGMEFYDKSNNVMNSNGKIISNSNKDYVFNDNVDNDSNTKSAKITKTMKNPKNNIRKSIGPYKVLKPLGRGTFSEVVLVTNNCEFYACKIISKKRLIGHEDAFENEIRIHQKMHHPNIVELIDLLMDEDNYYMILEYCSRGDLCNFLSRNGGASECVARHVIKQLLTAVSHVHEMSIAHRDIKPENILIDPLWNVKLSDFGLSDFYQEGKQMTCGCGSVLYASPECLSGCPYDGACADAWSCGVTAYTLLAGQTPWKTVAKRRARHKNEQKDKKKDKHKAGHKDEFKDEYKDEYKDGYKQKDEYKDEYKDEHKDEQKDEYKDEYKDDIKDGQKEADDDDDEEARTEILTCEIRLPSFFSPKCKDFVTKLLTKDWHSRMTVEEALRHPWLSESFDTRENQNQPNLLNPQNLLIPQNLLNSQNLHNQQNLLNPQILLNPQNLLNTQNLINPPFVLNQNSLQSLQSQQSAQSSIFSVRSTGYPVSAGSKKPPRRHTMEMWKSLVTEEKLASFIEDIHMKGSNGVTKATLSSANSVRNYKKKKCGEGAGAAIEACGGIGGINGINLIDSINGSLQESCLKRFIRGDEITGLLQMNNALEAETNNSEAKVDQIMGIINMIHV